MRRDAAQRKTEVPPKFPPHYLEQLIESSPDIVVAVERSGTVVFYNDGAERNLGFTTGEILGQNVAKLYPSIEEARRVMNAMRASGFGGPGKVKNFETVFVDRWGRRIPVAISGSILYDEAGLEIGSIGFAKDIREIRERDRMATLGEVAVAVCHEINNPLEVIANQVDLLRQFVRETTSDERAEDRTEAIRREVDKIQNIVNRLVDLSQGSASYATREYHAGTRMADLKSSEEEQSPVAQPDALAGLRVLVVDDDPAVCQSMSDLLAQQGCIVTNTNSGLQALKLFRVQPFDLVISDVVMPDLDGYDLFMEIKQLGDTPVVLMTGYYYDRDHVIKRSRLEGLEGVLFKKPVDPDRLRNLIRQLCHRDQPAEVAPTPA